MKKFLNLVLCIGVCFGMLLLPFQAYALEYEIVYQDGRFVLNSDDILDEKMEWMPGDTVVQRYTVTNQSQDKMNLYLEISTTMQLSSEMQEWLEISISSKECGWQHILDTEQLDSGYINERIEMGAFVPGQRNDLTIEISLSEEADNRCKEILTELEYELVAEVVESGKTETDSEEFGETETTETDSEEFGEIETTETDSEEPGETENKIGTEVDTKMETEVATDSGIDEVTVPDTGDSTKNPYLALLVASVLLLLWSYKGQRK